VSTVRPTFEERRADLVARAAAERAEISRLVAPLAVFDDGLARLGALRSKLPGVAVGAGLGLSALLLALPVGRFPVVRGGVALLQLAGSVRRLFDRR
jgi:hypothetical protein